MKLLCMSFDGDSKIERPEFSTIEEVWNYSNDIGSKWYFYPFHFVVTAKTIKDTPERLSFLKGKRISTVKKLFKKESERKENNGLDVDCFMEVLRKYILFKP